jgi:SprT protein
MAKKEVPLHALSAYLPDNALDPVLYYLNSYKIHLTITRERNTLLGDYRHSIGDSHHRISVNGNLNPYAFLITLLHELAHLITFDEYRNRVAPHGKEWKNHFSSLLSHFMKLNIFPDDIQQTLTRSIQNPAASSCSDMSLMRVLRKYDAGDKNFVLIEELSSGALFKLKDGRMFQRGEKLRKRYKGVDVKTGQTYLFNALYEVALVEDWK